MATAILVSMGSFVADMGTSPGCVSRSIRGDTSSKARTHPAGISRPAIRSCRMRHGSLIKSAGLSSGRMEPPTVKKLKERRRTRPTFYERSVPCRMVASRVAPSVADPIPMLCPTRAGKMSVWRTCLDRDLHAVRSEHLGLRALSSKKGTPMTSLFASDEPALDGASGAVRPAPAVLDLARLLDGMEGLGAADLFLKPPAPPTYKIAGRAVPTDEPPLTPEALETLLPQVLRPRDQERFATDWQVDFSFVTPDGRYRGNCYRQRGTPAMVFRRINTQVPTADELGLADVLKHLAMEKRGLVLVTGATGSGKSTTLAAMVDWRNENSEGHIVTIEDPIEFLHPDKGCVVSQREVGTDVVSFHGALKAALRQAPDVLLMGEIRDAEAAEAALHLSETGHLVFGTLHSTNANQSVDRMLQFFPPDRHPEILSLLAFNLRGIVSQRLIRGVDGRYCMAAEILIGSPRVRELLKRGDTSELKTAIAAGNHDGMQTFDQAVFDLYNAGLIDDEAALLAADSPSDLRLRMRGFVQAGR